MKRFALWLLLCAVPGLLMAEGEAPVIYNRTILHILPKPGSAAQPQAPDKDKKADGKMEPPARPRATKNFTVDIRAMQFLSQEGFIAQQPFTDKGGMLILIDPPDITILRRANLLAKTDVLFVRRDGVITKIAPNLSLAYLNEPISSDEPIHAFLFLKANTAKLDDIRPGDHIENPLFQTHPIILEESTAPEPQQAPPK